MLFYYERYKEAHRFKTAAEFAQWLSVQAVFDARENINVTLDYTPESIQKVETVLGSLHDQYVKNPKSISVNGLGAAYGAYIGEVIRRTEKNARWEKDDPRAGEKSYPFHWAGRVSFPMAWGQKRILNGPDDNVWNKYIELKKHGDQLKSAAGDNK